MSSVMIGRMASDPLTHRSAGIALVAAVREDSGRILRANDELAELLARPAAALVGTSLCQHLHPDDQPRALQALLRLLADPKTLYEDDNGRLVAANGREVRVHIVASVITTHTGPAIIVRVLGPSR